MDDFENRIQTAADELRQTTKLLTPPPVRRSLIGTPLRWTAFAVGVGAVLVAVVAIPGLIDGFQPVGSPDTTVPGSVPTTEWDPVDPTVTTLPPVTCSGTGAVPFVEAQALPPAVTETRNSIMENAIMCGIAELEATAGSGFTTDFGGGGAEMLAEWEAAGEGKLGVLVRILNMTPAEIQSGNGDSYHVWPAAFAYDRWEDIPARYIEELLTVYTGGELEELSGFGSYAGWRTGIDAEGNWMFFVAGD